MVNLCEICLNMQELNQLLLGQVKEMFLIYHTQLKQVILVGNDSIVKVLRLKKQEVARSCSKSK